MFNKVLAASVAVVALSAPAFAGSTGAITGTTSTTITGGSRNLTIMGDYSAEEHTVSASSEGSGASADAFWDSTNGPDLRAGTIVGNSTSSATASYSTNAVTNGSYLNDTQHSYTGTESTSMNGAFFNY